MALRFLAAAAILAVASAALAQQTAPAASLPPVVPHTCKKPPEHPGKLATDGQRRTWVQSANDYLGCLKKYALDQQAIAKPLIDQAKPYADAANTAIEEHNKAVAAFKEEQDKNN
jgi:hypothetical protein